MPLTSKHLPAEQRRSVRSNTWYPRLIAVVVACFAGATLAATAPEPEADIALAAGLALANAKNCMACHQVDTRRVGPPFASVASRYGGASGFVDYLAQTIRKGGRGRWGAVPMPAQPQVSEHEAAQLAKWILSLPAAPQP